MNREDEPVKDFVDRNHVGNDIIKILMLIILAYVCISIDILLNKYLLPFSCFSIILFLNIINGL